VTLAATLLQQRDERVSFCAEMLEQVEADPELIQRVITSGFLKKIPNRM
jgi:hypothetical protein